MPLVNQTAASVAQAFVRSVVLRHGSPESVLTDQGTNFESILMAEVCKLLGIKKLRTSPFHPRTDGQTERANRTITEWLASSGGDWEKQLPFVIYFLNCTVNASTKVSPFQLLFGRHPLLFQSSRDGHGVQAYDGSSSEYVVSLRNSIDHFHKIARHNAGASKREYTERYNAANCPRRWKPFSVGDKVKYKNYYPDRFNRKFSARYRGPFEVVACRGVNYKIVDDRLKARWVHHDEILHWRDDGKPPSTREETGSPGSLTSRRLSTVTISGSSSSAASSDEESGGVSGGSRLRRSTRNRRPPGWLRDYCT